MPVTFGRGAPPPGSPFEAGMLPDAQKEELCRSLLTEFGIGNIRERGYELMHACLIDPTHKDQASNPTASLNYSKLTYKCLGCGASGGLLWFIATCRGESSAAARDWLAQTTGLDGNVMDLTDLLRYFDAIYDPKRKSAPIPTYSPRMLEPWSLIHPYVTDPISEGGRGIPEQTVLDFKVGYAERYPVGKRPDGSPITSERIVLPHFWKGNLVGWQSRRLDVADGTPKFLSSADFPKDETIYNYQPRNERVVIVEAMFSVLKHVHAVPDMVATFGADITETQVKLLAKHPTQIWWPDNDKAGWKIIEGRDTVDSRGRVTEHHTGAAETSSRSCNVLVVENPYAADPADMETEDVVALIEAAVPLPVWTKPQVLLCYRCKEVAHDGPC